MGASDFYEESCLDLFLDRERHLDAPQTRIGAESVHDALQQHLVHSSNEFISLRDKILNQFGILINNDPRDERFQFIPV